MHSPRHLKHKIYVFNLLLAVIIIVLYYFLYCVNLIESLDCFLHSLLLIFLLFIILKANFQTDLNCFLCVKHYSNLFCYFICVVFVVLCMIVFRISNSDDWLLTRRCNAAAPIGLPFSVHNYSFLVSFDISDAVAVASPLHKFAIIIFIYLCIMDRIVLCTVPSHQFFTNITLSYHDLLYFSLSANLSIILFTPTPVSILQFDNRAVLGDYFIYLFVSFPSEFKHSCDAP